ncbi:hypothetical protein JFL47_02785 [Haemophilus haemoglobinophilus]|nr:hypothetical protein [Canicola haemoglobinophilus]
MSSYILRITKNNKITQYNLQNTHAIKFNAEENAQYELLDSNGNIIQPQVENGTLSWVDPIEQQQIAVIENYTGVVNTVHSSYTMEPATLGAKEVVTATQVGIGKSILLGASAVVGIATSAIAISKAGSKSSSSQPTPEMKNEEANETTTSFPKVYFDNITSDNIININEKQMTLKVTGRAENIEDQSLIHLHIGNAVYAGKVIDGKFSIEVDGKTLAVHKQIQASLSTDKSDKPVGEHQYEVDLVIDQPEISLNNVTEDNIVNKDEAKNPILITGSTRFVPDGTQVVVSCGCPSCAAMSGLPWAEKIATVKNGLFSVELESNTLVVDGKHSIRAYVMVEDNAGNIAINETVKEYQVKLSSSNANWQWHSVTEDNAVNAKEADTQNVTIRGEIVNLAKNETALVTFNVGEQEFAAIKQGNQYYAEVPATALEKSAPFIKAKVTITDNEGNQTNQEIAHKYQYDTQINAPQIINTQINNGMPISQKNALGSITISGQIQYDSDVAEKDVQIWVELNGERFNATLNQQQWTLSIPGQKFTVGTENKTLTILASVQDQVGNKSKASITSKYQLAAVSEKVTDEALLTEDVDLPSPPVQLYLDPISATDMEHQQYIGVSGKLVLNDDFLEGKNKSRVYAVNLEVDGKSYQGIVDRSHQTFTLKIPTADVPLINNKEISYRFDTAQTIYTLTANQNNPNHFQINTQPMPILGKNNIVFDNNTLFRDGKFALPEQQNTITITGRAEGNVRSGDTVAIRIGEKSFSTTLDNELKFSLEVKKSEISAGEKIVASLAEQQVEAIFSQAPELSDKFVSHHFFDATFQTIAPYFLKSQMFQSWANPPTLYHSNSAPFNLDKTAHLTYNFLKGNNSILFTSKDKEAVKKSLDIISKYTNIEFQEVSNDQYADIHYFMQPLQNRHLGFANYGGDVYLAASLRQYGHLLNQKATQTILHETLHSLGAKHPFEGEHRLPSVENKRSITVMSYFHDTEVEDLGIFDLVFLHYRFGVNRNQRTGDDTYSFKPVNTKTADHDIYIWDGAGVDTFDASDQAQGVNVNLTPGSWIYSGTKSQNFIIDPNNKYSNNEYFEKPDNVKFQGAVDVYSEKYLHTQGQAFIGFGTQIERLIGSSYNDVLTGNKANNHIYGGKGDDVINGGEGNDYLDGGSGKNTLSGNLGDDIYVVNSKEDQVIEKLNEGTDTVHSYIDYSLNQNVENISLFGSGKLSATGNSLNNVLIGNNSDNRLDGKAGSDTLTGGKGKDTFVFSTELNGNNIDTITDFTVGEDKIELSKAIFSEIHSQEEIIDHIRYDKETGKLFYHQDNITSEGTHFATISDNLLLNVQSFMLV